QIDRRPRPAGPPDGRRHSKLPARQPTGRRAAHVPPALPLRGFLRPRLGRRPHRPFPRRRRAPRRRPTTTILLSLSSPLRRHRQRVAGRHRNQLLVRVAATELLEGLLLATL